MIQIGFSVDVSEIDNLLKDLKHALDPTPVLDEAGSLLLARVRARFLEQKDAEGVPWVPSWASLRRAASGRGGGTLFDTGRLFHSLQLIRTESEASEIKTDVEYAEDHNLGLRGQIQREFMGTNDEDVDLMEALIVKRINRILGVG